MNPLKATLFAALLSSSLAVAADPESTKQAELLLDALGMEETLSQATAQMVASQTQQNPSLAPFKAAILEYFEQYMGYDSLKSEMVTAYVEAFSTAELKELNAFYGSALGKKAGKKVPEIMTLTMQTGATRVQANIKDLEGMIKAEAERMQQQQSREQQPN